MDVHLTEFDYYVFCHSWSIPAGLFKLHNLRNSDEGNWANNAVCLRLRVQVIRKTWKEVVDKDMLDLESCH